MFQGVSKILDTYRKGHCLLMMPQISDAYQIMMFLNTRKVLDINKGFGLYDVTRLCYAEIGRSSRKVLFPKSKYRSKKIRSLPENKVIWFNMEDVIKVGNDRVGIQLSYVSNSKNMKNAMQLSRDCEVDDLVYKPILTFSRFFNDALPERCNLPDTRTTIGFSMYGFDQI